MTQTTANFAASEFRGQIGAAREDVTPPPGIYARCWGAAKHDVAEGVHRPLTLTCVTFQAAPGEPPLALLSLDSMSWRSKEDEWAVRGEVVKTLGVDEARVLLCLTHTHAAPSLRTDDQAKPGGHLIPAYRATVAAVAVRAARHALQSARTATMTWHYGRCDLAANRDLPEPGGSRTVCGYNPARPADDTLLVGRATNDAGRTIATIVNYACHPTTLAWDNRLISPDYVGAMRELVERDTGAPCLFLQGASGELAPAEQYVGDTAVADRHGRRVGHSVLAALEAMGAPRTRLTYGGVVESGTALALWRREPAAASPALSATVETVDLPLRAMPTVAQLEAQWRACDDPVMKERLWRRRGVRNVVGDGDAARVPVWVWRIGDALLIGHPNEAYSSMQTELRRRLGPRAVAVINLANGSAGYLPTGDAFDAAAYPAVQTPFDRGALERVTAKAEEMARGML